MKSIICIILLSIITLLILNNKSIESFDQNNLSGKWTGQGLESGPIIFEHKGNIINATYPKIGAIIAIIDDKKITWRIQKTGQVILGELIADKNGDINSIKWSNGITWNKLIEERKDHDLPSLDIPSLEGNWWSPNMNNGSIKLTQKNNKVYGTYDKLGNGVGTIVNNKIIWVWGNSSVKTIGDIIIKNDKALEIKWQNGFVWKLIQPSVNIAGKWTGSGLVSGPIIILQHNNTINAVYPGYGPMTGEIINNRIEVKWVFTGASIGGTVIKDSNNHVEKIKWDNNLEWHFGEMNKESVSHENNLNSNVKTEKTNKPNSNIDKKDISNHESISKEEVKVNKNPENNAITNKKVEIPDKIEKPDKPFLNIDLKSIAMSLADTITRPLPPANLKDKHPTLTSTKETFINQSYFISRGPAHIIR